LVLDCDAVLSLDIHRVAGSSLITDHPDIQYQRPIHIDDDKYLHILEDNHMNTIEHEGDPSTDDTLDAQRDIIKQSINEIANEIGMKMRDVGLTFPLYITVRNSGDALVTIATPIDPSDEEWQQATAIVCRTLEERVGCDRLRGRELACAIANAGSINAADVTAD
jgi:hypothetical protein